MAKMQKGQQFERDICRQLSLWFSGGEYDDWFWRSSNSGGRATVRTKQNKRTIGQYGDIAATDPRGIPLLKFFCFELKRGYNRTTLHDLIDSPKRSAKQVWQQWIEKAERNARESGSKTWAIIHKRDRREAVIVIPEDHMPFGGDCGTLPCDVGIAFASLSRFLKSYEPHIFTGDQ